MNKKTYALIGLGVAGAALGYAAWRRRNMNPLPVAEKVDLEKYMGEWFEIARLPTIFEKNCYNAKAQYSLNPDGTVKVVNSCTRGSLHGNKSESEGVAEVVDPDTNAKLKVQFRWPFKGDYHIIDVGKNYEYALVGTPSREYLWVLSRKHELDTEILEHLISFAHELGFDTDKLIITEHAHHKAPEPAIDNVEE